MQNGDRVRNTRYGYVGTVEKSIGRDRYLVHADKGEGVTTPVEADTGTLVPLTTCTRCNRERDTDQLSETKAGGLACRPDTPEYDACMRVWNA
jgi:hypothetical protein